MNLSPGGARLGQPQEPPVSDSRRRDPYAAALRDGSLNPRRVSARRGRGSYSRKGRPDRAEQDS